MGFPAKPFHIALHACPTGKILTSAVQLDGQACTRLELSPNALHMPLSVSFDDTIARLSQLDRLFIEPDGSFVWVGKAAESAWQVDGILFDRGERLQYVELRGTCAQEAFDRLLHLLRTPETRLVVQLMQQAVFLSEAEFRRYAWSN